MEVYFEMGFDFRRGNIAGCVTEAEIKNRSKEGSQSGANENNYLNWVNNY